MNIPNKVKIGYKDYKINKQENDVILGSAVCYGNIDYNTGVINLSTLYSDDQQKCTFIHEAIHGIDDIFGIGLEEEQVEKIAKGVYMLIKDNPNIFKQNEPTKTVQVRDGFGKIIETRTKGE